MSPVKPSCNRGPTENSRVKNLSAFRLNANAVSSGVLAKKPIAPPPDHVPAVGSTACTISHPEYKMSPMFIPTMSTHVNTLTAGFIAGLSLFYRRLLARHLHTQ